MRAPSLKFLSAASPGLFLALLLSHTACGQVPQIMRYQGLVSVDGANFDGAGRFKFGLVNGNGSVTYWSNDGSSTAGGEPTTAVTIAASKGLYSILLGDSSLPNMIPIPPDVFKNTDVRLRVWFNDGAHGSQLLTPDQRIAADGFAFQSQNFAGALGGDVTGAQTATVVARIQNIPVAASAPVTGQVLKYNGSAWAPAADNNSGIMSVTASSPLSVANANSAPAISLGIVPIALGGTGSATQNFVDLTTAQTIGGAKQFNALATFSGGAAASLSSASDSALSGRNTGAGYGVSGISASGAGVLGSSSSGNGVWGGTDSPNYAAIYGENSANWTGVAGISLGSGTGVYGESDGQSGYGSGVVGITYSGSGSGVYGENVNASGGTGVFGSSFSNSGTGVYGENSANGVGVGGSSSSGIGVSGRSTSGPGVQGYSQSLNGIDGYSDTGYAGFFHGKAYVTGDLGVGGRLTKGAGSFKIDHPLDPANKYLSHSFVESPDMMNIYNGNTTTDAKGKATIRLPDYFTSLNRDYRYQLTVIGQFAQAIVANEIQGNAFVIRTSKGHVKVSWQVTGIRQDAYANAHRIPNSEEKTGLERGAYLHPELFGQSEEKRIGATKAFAPPVPPSVSQSHESTRLRSNLPDSPPAAAAAMAANP